MKNIVLILIAVAVVAFAADYYMKTQAVEPTVAINDLGTFTSTDRAEAVTRFAGKPTAIFIIGTFCPHCQVSMPVYKSEIYDVYNDRANVFAYVIDGEQGARFNVEGIPQGYDAQLDYENLTGEVCEYVPSWVLLDTEGSVATSKCGSGEGADDIAAALDALLTE